MKGGAQWLIERLTVFIAIHIVAGDAVIIGKSPGEQRGERGTAQRRGDVTTLEDDTLRGEFVEMRRLDHGMPHEPIIGPALVITENDHDVRRHFGGVQQQGE